MVIVQVVILLNTESMSFIKICYLYFAEYLQEFFCRQLFLQFIMSIVIIVIMVIITVCDNFLK